MSHLRVSLAKLFFIFALIVGFTACENAGSTIAGNPNLNGGQPVVTMGKLTDGKVMVTMPLDVFGASSDDVAGATVDIRRNGSSYFSGLAATDYYVDSHQAVIFYLSNLAAGDEMEFDVARVDGQEDTYSGTVSDTEDTYAIDEEATIESANIIEPAVAIINLAATDGRMSDSYTDNTVTSEIDEQFSDLTRRVVRTLVAAQPRNAESGSTTVDYASDCTENGSIQVAGPATFTSTDTTLDMEASVTVTLNDCEQEIQVEVDNGDCTYTQTIDGSLSLELNWHYDADEEEGTGDSTLISNGLLTLTTEFEYSLEINLTSNDEFDFMDAETTSGTVTLNGAVYDIELLHALTAATDTADFCPGNASSSDSSSGDGSISLPSTAD